MSVELNCAQGGQSFCLCKRSIELVELPYGDGVGKPSWWGGRAVSAQGPQGPWKGEGLGSWNIQT